MDLHVVSGSRGCVIRFVVGALLDSEVVLLVVVVRVILFFLLIQMILQSLRQSICGLVDIRFASILGIELGTQRVTLLVVQQQRIEMLLEVLF